MATALTSNVTNESRHVRQTLEQLVRSAPGGREPLRRKLQQIGTPLAVAEAAFAGYDASANEEFLLHVRTYFEELGVSAWPALSWIAMSRPEEAEVFLGPIARCPDISSESRLAVLRAFLQCPSASVRAALFDHLSELPPDLRVAVLQILAGDAESEIRSRAREQLES